MKSKTGKPDAKRRSKPEAGHNRKSLAIPELENRLGSTPGGLSHAETEDGLAQYGPNRIMEKKINSFVTNFRRSTPRMIQVAVIPLGAVRYRPHLTIIRSVLASHTVIGFWEESWGGNAIAALNGKRAVQASVKLVVKKPVARTPRIAARAYRLYQQPLPCESQLDHDWLESEREIRKR